jgi:hypothetical protein
VDCACALSVKNAHESAIAEIFKLTEELLTAVSYSMVGFHSNNDLICITNQNSDWTVTSMPRVGICSSSPVPPVHVVDSAYQ